MSKLHLCSCGKVLENEEDGDNEVKYIKHNLACKDCRKNHACCVRYSPEHAAEYLERLGYKVTKNVS